MEPYPLRVTTKLPHKSSDTKRSSDLFVILSTLFYVNYAALIGPINPRFPNFKVDAGILWLGFWYYRLLL